MWADWVTYPGSYTQYCCLNVIEIPKAIGLLKGMMSKCRLPTRSDGYVSIRQVSGVCSTQHKSQWLFLARYNHLLSTLLRSMHCIPYSTQLSVSLVYIHTYATDSFIAKPHC